MSSPARQTIPLVEPGSFAIPREIERTDKVRGAWGHRDRRLVDLTHERIMISLFLSSLVRCTADSQLGTLTGDTLVGDVGFGDHISHV